MPQAGSVCFSDHFFILFLNNFCSLFVISTETFLISRISFVSRIMRSWQGNEKAVKTKSIKVVYKVLSVNPKVVCNPHVELVVL